MISGHHNLKFSEVLASESLRVLSLASRYKSMAIKFNKIAGKVPGKDIDLQYKLLDEEFDEFREAVENNDTIGIRDALADIRVIAWGMSYLDPSNKAMDNVVLWSYLTGMAMGHQIETLLSDDQVVADSNFSKFCDSDLKTSITITAYKEKGIDAVAKRRGEYYVVYSKQDQTVNGKHYPEGKILKSVSYKEPVFAGDERTVIGAMHKEIMALHRKQR